MRRLDGRRPLLMGGVHDSRWMLSVMIEVFGGDTGTMRSALQRAKA